jgi:hypothetical protein
MSLILRRSHPLPGDSCRQPACHTSQELEAAAGRHEPLRLEARRAPVDPYVAWLAQREAARERDDGSRIRWVYRHRGTGATTPNPKL